MRGVNYHFVADYHTVSMHVMLWMIDGWQTELEFAGWMRVMPSFVEERDCCEVDGSCWTLWVDA